LRVDRKPEVAVNRVRPPVVEIRDPDSPVTEEVKLPNVGTPTIEEDEI
jgi:hypothetical protein